MEQAKYFSTTDLLIANRRINGLRLAKGQDITVRVHAPFLYHPDERKLTAKTTLKGFEMLKEYCHLNNLPFKEDGAMEVATSEQEARILDKYLEGGYSNGLSEDELKLLTRD